jgi:hypothetical protein
MILPNEDFFPRVNLGMPHVFDLPHEYSRKDGLCQKEKQHTKHKNYSLLTIPITGGAYEPRNFYVLYVFLSYFAPALKLWFVVGFFEVMSS